MGGSFEITEIDVRALNQKSKIKNAHALAILAAILAVKGVSASISKRNNNRGENAHPHFHDSAAGRMDQLSETGNHR
jgi:hypothetical protein